MQGRLPLVFLCFVSLMMAGCIQSGGETWGGVGDYQVSADWHVIEVETKTEYYPDGENVSWSVESSLVSESINSGGGNVVGMLFSLNYPNEDEYENPGLCLGVENNVADVISAHANKGSWMLQQSGH